MTTTAVPRSHQMYHPHGLPIHHWIRTLETLKVWYDFTVQ